jgi:hypothetical protein
LNFELEITCATHLVPKQGLVGALACENAARIVPTPDVEIPSGFLQSGTELEFFTEPVILVCGNHLTGDHVMRVYLLTGLENAAIRLELFLDDFKSRYRLHDTDQCYQKNDRSTIFALSTSP